MKVLLLTCLSIIFFNVYAQACDLTITIPNVKNSKGFIHVAVFSGKHKDDFTKIGKEYKVIDFKTEDAKGKYIVKDLPEGEYAIAVFHDENGDKKCNTNLLGIPKEGYGFSRIDKLRAQPNFETSKILIKKNTTIEITLIF